MISQKKLERIKIHLLEVEKQTGGKLRTEPSYNLCNCPMGNFSPDENENGYKLGCYGPILEYRLYDDYHKILSIQIYDIYEYADEHWWKKLSIIQREKYTREIIKWLKERK